MMFRKAIIVFSSVLLFQACSPTSEGDLFSDVTSLSECPESSCAQGVPNAADTRVLLTSPYSNVLPKSYSLAEISGDCYVSLYPNNYFALTSFKNPAGQELKQAGSESFPTGYLPAGFIPTCKNGKFYIPISLTGKAAGDYAINLQLVVVDSSGNKIYPQFRTIQTFVRYNP